MAIDTYRPYRSLDEFKLALLEAGVDMSNPQEVENFQSDMILVAEEEAMDSLTLN